LLCTSQQAEALTELVSDGRCNSSYIASLKKCIDNELDTRLFEVDLGGGIVIVDILNVPRTDDIDDCCDRIIQSLWHGREKGVLRKIPRDGLLAVPRPLGTTANSVVVVFGCQPMARIPT
jgi:hypothetical protein